MLWLLWGWFILGLVGRATQREGYIMSFRVGDTVFLSHGTAAEVIGRDPGKGTVVLDRETAAVRHNTRHGYLNGIAPERREEFLSIMDAVKEFSEPKKRVEELQKRIDALLSDPRNMMFVKYLESERNHIINTSGYMPRFYGTDDAKLR
jgi:hypothetical protein